MPEPCKAIVDRQIQSADDIKAVAQDKVVHRRDGAGRGIFHRQNAVTALAVFHRAEHILKAFVCDKLAFGKKPLSRFI